MSLALPRTSLLDLTLIANKRWRHSRKRTSSSCTSLLYLTIIPTPWYI